MHAPPDSRVRECLDFEGTLQIVVLLLLVGGVVFVISNRDQRAPSEPPPRAPTHIDETGAMAPTYDPPARARPIVDTEVAVKEDHYYASILKLSRAAMVTVKIELLAGPPVESWAFDESGFRQFEEAGKSLLGGKFEHFPDYNMVDVRHDERTARLAAGTYYIVVENTDGGSTKPPTNMRDDTAKVRLTIISE